MKQSMNFSSTTKDRIIDPRNSRPVSNQSVAATNHHILREMKKYILILFMGLWLFSCNDPYEGTTFTAYEELPISSYLASRPDDFSMWVDLLKYTNLYNTLNLQTAYTVFAPNNEAMTEYLASKGLTSVQDLDKDESIYLVKYHILYGRILTRNQFATGAIEWPTATDDKLSLAFTDGGIVFINNYSQIMEFDLPVTNGVVHVLNKVLIPITTTIYNRLEQSDYSIMKEAVDVTGFNAMLNKVFEEVMDNDGQIVKKRFFYTLFAITNQVYSSFGINSFADLKTKLNVSDSDYGNAQNALNKYVAYHILDQLKSTDNLAIAEDETSKNINTLADKELINISTDENNMIRINYDENTNESVSIVENDIACKNGVIHGVDSWMPVKTPPATIVLWELTDYAELASVCKYFQSPFPNGGSSTYSKTLDKDEISTYTWESIPSEKYGVVTYVNNRNNDGVYYEAENHDHLRLSTGIGGWVEMKSPVIVKANYKITLSYISYFSTASSGEMQCYLDGVKLGSSFAISNSNQDMIAKRTLSTSIVFNETDEHTFRIVGIDGRSLTLDYLLLEPIN